MRLRDFNKIEEHRHWHARLLEVDRHRYECLMVGRSPCIRGEVEGAVMFLARYVMIILDHRYCLLTCSILAIRWRLFTNTCLTSRETVLGEGMYVPGLPVFISELNPRSATMLKGRILSETQRTISAL